MNIKDKMNNSDKCEISLYITSVYTMLIEFADYFEKCNWAAENYFGGGYRSVKREDLNNYLATAANDITETEIDLYRTMYETWTFILTRESVYTKLLQQELEPIRETLTDPPDDIDVFDLFAKFYTAVQLATKKYNMDISSDVKATRKTAFKLIRQDVDDNYIPAAKISDTPVDFGNVINRTMQGDKGNVIDLFKFKS